MVPAAAYLSLSLAWAWPLPLHLATRFAFSPGDPLLVTYLLWWNAHTVPLTDAMWNVPFYWPMADALALTEHGAGLSTLGSPIQWLGGSPLFAYNVLLIVSSWWSALATYALVRRLTGSATAAFCGGLAYGFAPYRASQLGHLQLLASWWMPLALLALHGYCDDGSGSTEGRAAGRRRRWLALFGVSWLMQSLTNGYYLFFFPVLIGAWVAVFTPWRSDPRRAITIGATWLAFSLPLIPVLLKYYTVQQRLGLARSRAEMQGYSATFAAFLHTSPLLRFWHGSEGRSEEDLLFPGVATVTAILSAGVLVRWRGVAARRFVFYVSAALLMTWMAFGPAPRPGSIDTLWHAYEWLAWLPGFSGLRVPARFFMLTTLCLAVAAGLAISGLIASFPRAGRIVAAAAVLGLLADGWISAMPLGAAPRPFDAPMAKDAVVLELPVTDENVNIAAIYRGMLHHRPVVNGYAGYRPPYASVMEWALARRDPSVLTELRRGRPLYVAVANHVEAPRWTAFIEAQNDARLLTVGGGGRLYVLPPAPYPRQVAVGAPVAPVRVEVTADWLIADIGRVMTVRAVDLRTRGHVILLRQTVRVETSVDGVTWALGAEESSGGLALIGVLAQPGVVPLRLVLPDAPARYVRINTPAFGLNAISVYGP